MDQPAVNDGPRKADRTTEVTHFHEAAEWTGLRITDYAAWLHARRGIVTASRSAALLGESPFGDPLSVYADMVAPQPVPEHDDLALDDPRTWGNVLEEPIARKAADYYHWQIMMGGALLVSRKHPHLGATLDAEILPEGSDGWLVYEGKTTNAWRARDWDEANGVPPTHILIQAQHQLLVTQAPGCVLFCLAGGQKPIRVDVEPDAEFHAMLIETVDAFLGRVVDLDPPPATAISGPALKQLHPEDDGSTVALPADAVEWTRELNAIAEQVKTLDMREKELKNLLRQSIGDAQYGELPEEVAGKARWKWGTTHVAERTQHVNAYTMRALRLVKAAKETKQRRRGG